MPLFLTPALIWVGLGVLYLLFAPQRLRRLPAPLAFAGVVAVLGMLLMDFAPSTPPYPAAADRCTALAIGTFGWYVGSQWRKPAPAHWN